MKKLLSVLLTLVLVFSLTAFGSASAEGESYKVGICNFVDDASLNQIIANIRSQQKSKRSNRIGYNVLTDKYIDMIEGGVSDPAKVTRGALENAASIAAMILTTEALITDIPEPEKPAAAPQMPEY